MKKINACVSKFGDHLQSLALLVIRLAWGFQLYESGWGHLTHVGQTAGFFESLRFFGRIPMPFPTANVYVSGATEFAGGILLMLGLLSRPVCVLLLFNFFVAYATDGWIKVTELLHFHNPDDFINYDAFPFLATSLLVLAFGPGKLALDAWIFKKGASGD